MSDLLTHYYALMDKKRKDIERLNKCRGSLEGKQGEFNANEPKCLEPELTTKTWHGTHATEFDEIRESGIHTPYVEIAGAQFAKVYEVIAEKITSLLAEIEAIQQTINRIIAEQTAAAAASAKAAR